MENFFALAKGAVDLGVIPALALFLVLNLHRQNQRLTETLRDMESQFLKQYTSILSDYRELLLRVTVKPSNTQPRSNKTAK